MAPIKRSIAPWLMSAALAVTFIAGRVTGARTVYQTVAPPTGAAPAAPFATVPPFPTPVVVVPSTALTPTTTVPGAPSAGQSAPVAVPGPVVLTAGLIGPQGPPGTVQVVTVTATTPTTTPPTTTTTTTPGRPPVTAPPITAPPLHLCVAANLIVVTATVGIGC